MTVYCLEMRSTADWQRDIRYREYTTSAKKAELFRQIPKIRFTDSGHGIVPAVREHTGRKEPRNMILQDYVVEQIVALNKASKPRPTVTAKMLEDALRPFVDAYRRAADPIGDSDLYDQQPRSVSVTLGNCRRAALLLRELEGASVPRQEQR